MRGRRLAGFGMIFIGLLGVSLFKEVISGLLLAGIGVGVLLLVLVLVVGGTILVATGGRDAEEAGGEGARDARAGGRTSLAEEGWPSSRDASRS